MSRGGSIIEARGENVGLNGRSVYLIKDKAGSESVCRALLSVMIRSS